MSKIIKLTPVCMDEVRRDFETALSNIKLSDGKINFTKTFGAVNRKAQLYFTEIAWLKMLSLVREFDKEVAWHGVAKRCDDPERDEYIISDILVYPQEVTGATVNTDQEKYERWLMSHDDEVFNNIRMQGHSHVNMSTSPSAVDISHQEKILDQLEDDMFYIFLIWNKRNEKTIKIYDLAKNVLFETADVTVSIIDDGTGVESLLRDAKEMVQNKKTVTYGSGYNGVYSYGSAYNTGYSYSGGSYGQTADAKNQLNEKSVVTPASAPSTSEFQSQKASSPQPAGNLIQMTSGKKKRKGKRKDRKNRGGQNESLDYFESLFDYDGFGD